MKNNVYDMLGDLAQDFNNEQLDTLFSKFEACTGRPVPDAMKIMDLMRRLAKSDTKVRPAFVRGCGPLAAHKELLLFVMNGGQTAAH